MRFWIAIAAPHHIWRILRQLGGVGLILLGLADNSVVPMPGSMDALTVVLASSKKEPWLYYAAMATLGAVIGGYVTYRLGQKGGKESLEKRLSKQKADLVYKKFEERGFNAVLIPAMLPPPVPIVPFLLAAGAMQYSRRKFLTALAVGRGIRFTVVAYLGARYGRHVLRLLTAYYRPILFTLIGLAVVGGAVSLFYYLRWRRKQRAQAAGRPSEVPQTRQTA